MKNFKIFLRYLFDIRELVKGIKEELIKFFKPKKVSLMFFFVGVFLFLKLPEPRNRVYLAVFLILSLIIYLRGVYIGGDHIRWWRKKNKIKSKKESLREEFEEVEEQIKEKSCKNINCNFKSDNQEDYDEKGFCRSCSEIKSDIEREESN